MAVVILTCCATVAIEGRLHHATRITRFYVTRERDGVLTVSHEPLGLYRQDKGAFFADRARAYALVARSLSDEIHTVMSASVWIDYEQEGWKVEERPNRPLKRLTAVWFYWVNTENWTRDPGASWYAIGNRTYRVAAMATDEFVMRFGKEE